MITLQAKTAKSTLMTAQLTLVTMEGLVLTRLRPTCASARLERLDFFAIWKTLARATPAKGQRSAKPMWSTVPTLASAPRGLWVRLATRTLTSVRRDLPVSTAVFVSTNPARIAVTAPTGSQGTGK